ncbi:MFS transporter [Purpureocillium lilacinum]|uniref:MFS transporter n=1 Tax=Purpureocillium lilacinum TaxID=33203 RepID=A0A179G3F6_PURLI|nr:MFS transporter [Purpureocillium lilacinum]OAQ71903.1 MFS transporter [Purpureocillium lilacinum]
MGQDEKLPSAPAPQSLPQPLDRGVAAIEDEGTVDPTNETAAKGTTPAAGEDERKFLAGMQMWLVASSLTTASFLVLLDNAIVATVCFPIAAAIQPLVGKIYTQFRLKHVYLSFFFIFELGSLICGVATSSTMLIVGRAIAGIGVAGVFAGALIIIGVAVMPEQRALVTGICLSCAQLGIVIGPLIGGALTEKVSWRWCFYINLPLGAIVLGGTVFVTIADQTALRPARDVMPTLYRSLDLVGFLLLSPSSIMLLLALQWGGNTHAWSSATIIGLFCGAGVLFLVFVTWEGRKGADALIPTPVVRNRVVVAACVVAMSIMGTTILASYWMPIYFQTVRGKSPLTSGVNMLPNIIPSVVFGILTGFLIGKVGYYLPFAVVGGALTCVATGLLSILRPDSSTGYWIGVQFLLGAARGLVLQTSFISIPHATTPALVPTAVSMSIFCQYMGGAISLSLANVIFLSSLKSQLLIDAPGVDPRLIIDAGAYSVRDVGIPEELLLGVLRAYCTSVDRVFYLALAVSVLLFVSACCSGWVDTRKATKEEECAGETCGGQTASTKTQVWRGS